MLKALLDSFSVCPTNNYVRGPLQGQIGTSGKQCSADQRLEGKEFTFSSPQTMVLTRITTSWGKETFSEHSMFLSHPFICATRLNQNVSRLCSL